MDRALDDVVRERQQNKRQRNQRRSTPRSGVRKLGKTNGSAYDESRLWVHDKFEGVAVEEVKRPFVREAYTSSRLVPTGALVKVENVHYELGQDELLDLFRRQGPVMKLELLYDRAGRSEGIAFVTYEVEADATAAIHAYNGANANGQPIKLTLVTRNTAASAGNPGRASQSQPRSLFDRIGNTNKNPHERRHSADDRRDPTRKATPPGIDRYVPPERRRERDRERAQSGPRPVGGRDATRGRRGGGGGGTGAGRENGRDGGGVGRSGNGGSFRQRKTVEELDAEMNDYFGCAEQPIDGCINMAESTTGVAATAVAPLVDEDDDMIL